ncbi:MAG: amylo-alpha-1,6-glucosidase [Pseudobutyrivibrio sp.]|nr:amylo-alpha-1,6-glucosidase [Pseudobutyrivibrio sp.]
MQFQLRFDSLGNYKNNIYREFLLTNGLGGYASSTIIGAHNRLSQGYLVANLSGARVMTLSKTNERLVSGSRIYDLTTAQHRGPYSSEFNQGNMHQQSFTYDGTASFEYQAGDMFLTKTLSLVQGKNQLMISYTLENKGAEAGVIITPVVNYRDVDQAMTIEDLKKELPIEAFSHMEKDGMCGFTYSPKSNENVRISVLAAGVGIAKRNNIYDENMELQVELDQGNKGLDCHLMPYDFVLSAGEDSVATASFVITVEEKTGGDFEALPLVELDTAFDMEEENQSRLEEIIDQAGLDPEDELLKTLLVAGDQFVILDQGVETIISSYQKGQISTREAMLSLPGILLKTHRYDLAGQVLKAFTKYVKDGMLPSGFEGNKPIYSSVDASLWYFYGVYSYLNSREEDSAWEFVEEEIYPSLLEIMSAYRKGTRLGIGMDDDALMKYQNPQTINIEDADSNIKKALTNILWYNALMSMEAISRGIAKRTHNKPENFLAYAGGCSQLAVWVKESFNSEFWNQEKSMFYRAIAGEEKDEEIDLTQIFVCFLPFSLVEDERRKAILDLAASHVDEFSHSLLGAYVIALMSKDADDETKEYARSLMANLEAALVKGCVGQLQESDGLKYVAEATAVGLMIEAHMACK